MIEMDGRGMVTADFDEMSVQEVLCRRPFTVVKGRHVKITIRPNDLGLSPE